MALIVKELFNNFVAFLMVNNIVSSMLIFGREIFDNLAALLMVSLLNNFISRMVIFNIFIQVKTCVFNITVFKWLISDMVAFILTWLFMVHLTKTFPSMKLLVV